MTSACVHVGDEKRFTWEPGKIIRNSTTKNCLILLNKMSSGIYFVKLSPMLLSYLHLCFHHLLLVPIPLLASFHQPLHGQLEKILYLNFASSSSDALLACSLHSSLSLCNSSQPLVLFFLSLSLFLFFFSLFL